MSEQNTSNTSFAHAFLPGLILGLIVGAVAGAFVPDIMSANKFKVNPAHAGSSSHTRDNAPVEIDPETQALIDAAEAEAAAAAESTEDAAEDIIDDAESTLPSSP